jgi:hypothetical protein
MTHLSPNHYQIWLCTTCSQERQWGFGRLNNQSDHTAHLQCSTCHQTTAHAYSRIVLDMNHPEIYFGDRIQRSSSLLKQGLQ